MSTEEQRQPDRPETNERTEETAASEFAPRPAAPEPRPHDATAEFAAFAAAPAPEPAPAGSAYQRAPEPAPDWARMDALRAARPQPSLAAASPGRSRFGGLAAAGLLLLGSLGGGVAGSAATMALMPRSNAVQVAPVARQTSTLQTTSAAAPAKTSIAAIAREVGPAVVMVLTREGSAPGGARPRTEGEGTGFIVDASGLILTNNHVVEGANRITIVFGDQSRVDAKVVGRDPRSDLAVLKADIPADKLVVATLGDSDQLEAGEQAIAIGAPFGLDHTVTAGIVSAVNRDWGNAGGRPMRGLIQTDAPVNPGNSGGPLLNGAGEVIGINTAIESPVRGSVGIGFAIPINQAKRLLPQLSSGKSVEHPWLGISGVAITPDIVQEQSLTAQSGVLVAEVIADGPAQKAGLRGGSAANRGDAPVGGDIITAVDGNAVKTVQEISRYLDTLKVGDKVRLAVVRDGKPQEITVTLGAWQDAPATAPER